MVVKENDLEPLEFTVAVTNEDIYRLDNYKIQLKKLFDVQLAWKREEILSLSHEQDNQWFYITEGSAKARQLAKEYIKAVFQPEITQVINADIYGCLNLADEIEDIQRTSGACITQLNEELFEIKGSEMAATLACSKFEQAIGVFQNNNKIVENNFPDGTENELKFYGLKRSEVKEDLRKVEELNNINQKDLTTTDQEQRCDTHFAESNETTHGLVRQTNTLCSTAVVGCPDLKEPNVSENPENLGDFPDKSDPDSGCEKLDQEQETLSSQSHDNVETDSEPTTMRVRDFAAKLGYKESEISSAMEKLGPEADKNAILLELVNAQASMKQLEEGPSGANFKGIVSTPKISDPDYLRPIVIDGSNVAMSHGNQRVFSCRGIGIAVDWFLQHGHREITVFVPQWRKEASKTNSPIINQEVLRRLEDDHFLKWTPARIIRGRRVTCYDDRYIVQLASENDGVIVSNDAFRDLENECPEFKKVIEQRLLMYTFVNDRFMPPDDPLGRHGPKLKEFLRKGMGQLCPYGRKCTYGKRCKYLHQERNSKSEAELTAGLVNGDQSLPVLPEIPYGDTRPIESHPIQSRPLPPLPEQQIPANILSKPLPLPPNPYLQTAFNMSQLFPPTLRSNGQSNTAVRQIKTMSDPTPTSQEFDDVQEQIVCRNFHRIMSMPSLDGASMGPAPQLTGHPSPHGNQSHIVTSNGTFATSIYPHNHPDVLSGRMPMHPVPPHAGGSRPTSGEWLPDEAYGACGGYQLYSAQPPPVPPRYHNNQPLPNQASNYDMAGNHWGMSYSQQPHGYPLPYQFTQGNLAYYDRTYSRTPYHGQGNTFFRSRAPLIVGNYEVTDNPGSQDELRIKAYEKLTEVFPENGEKILKILDDHPEVSDIKELMEYMLEEKDK